MELIGLLYLADVATYISVFIFVLGLIVSFISLTGIADIPSSEEIRRKLVVIFIRGAALILLSILVPSQKVIYAYAGLTVVKEISTRPEVSEMYSKVIKIVNEKLDEQIKETVKGE